MKWIILLVLGGLLFSMLEVLFGAAFPGVGLACGLGYLCGTFRQLEKHGRL
jgi:hypothetical protein